MKKIGLLFTIIATALLVSCDVIDENEYLKEGTAIWNGRKIVVYDFTGHCCGNCPGGHQMVNTLQEKFGEAIIPVAVHIGYYAMPKTNGDKYTYDFRCDEGDYLGGRDYETGYFGEINLPAGMINYVKAEEIKGIDSWAVDAAKYYSSYPEFAMNVEASVVDGKIKADVKLETSIANSRKLTMVAYLVENKIIQWQKNYFADPADIENYEHNHVLRCALDGKALGESVKDNTDQLANGDVLTKSYSHDVNPAWNLANCEVVAFVYDTDTKEILQAEIVELPDEE